MKPALRSAALLLAAASGPALLPGRAAADVKLPAVLSDRMVLQRDMAVPIWGTAAPDEAVTVEFRGQKKAATAGKDGKWAVKLDALKAGGPDKLTVKGKNEVVLDDVLVGEVWVGSGQSNMQGTVGGYAKGDPVLAKLAAETYPKVRLSQRGGKWAEAVPANNAGASAILFAFGVALQKDLDVPVGLMVGAVGGTPSGHWLSQAAFDADAAVKAQVAEAAKAYDPDRAKAQYEAQVKKWEGAAAEAKQAGKKEPQKPAPPLAPGECRGKLGHLYEANVRPMLPYGIRGVLWDQGESGTAVEKVDQYTLMGALIKGWRNEWGQDFPFIYVQKPSGEGCAWDPADPITAQAEKFEPLPKGVPADGAYREHHVRIMRHPNTYMATASDLGHGIHPVNKSGYGARAERVALGAVYGKRVEIYGPTYKSHAVEGNKVRVSFDHVGQGLAFRHGEKLQGFAIAGADGKFSWADATIDGDAVVLSSPAVEKPEAAEYAYANRHPWANLFNKDGLPALPFRTEPPKEAPKGR